MNITKPIRKQGARKTFKIRKKFQFMKGLKRDIQEAKLILANGYHKAAMRTLKDRSTAHGFTKLPKRYRKI